MFSIAGRTATGAAILLIMPVIVWISGWTWQPEESIRWLTLTFWMTETAGKPWEFITHLALCAWFLWCLRFRLKAAVMLFIILTATLVIGQNIKSWVKDRVQEPRPFVVWLEKTHHIPVKAFYALSWPERGNLVKQQFAQQTSLPRFLRHHWQKGAGFAFPSGHSLFAATWALLAVGLLWPRRRVVTIVVLLLWATGVMGSRLLLGMHWPQDLIAATLIAWLLVTIACWLAQRFCGPLSPPPPGKKESIRQKQGE